MAEIIHMAMDGDKIKSITVAESFGRRDTFEIVEEFPLGYTIWNIGQHMPDGYLPLCRVIAGTYQIEPDTLKAIKIDGAQKILAAIGGGQSTIETMERYIRRHQNAKPDAWEYRQVCRMREALPVMREIRWP